MTKPPRKPVARMTTYRDGTTVALVFTCKNEYRAIKLYDELTARAGAGSIELEINVGPQGVTPHRDPALDGG
jgi:hypothetical protein